MAINLYNYPLSHFQSLRNSNTIRLSPQIQRRPVWSDKSKMFFIDSLARQVPVGAVTLYRDDSAGYAVWEVIDGKQRLSALFEYLDDGFTVEQSVIENIEQEELADVGLDLALPIYGKVKSNLDQVATQRLLQYQIPVFEVAGDRDQAVQAFTRMNLNSYVLKPQEIRHAVYSESAFLAAADKLAEDFTTFMSGSTTASMDSGLIALGVTSSEGYKRMQDIQFSSELLALAIVGDQHRRDKLNTFYDMYSSPGTAATATLVDATSKVSNTLRQLATIFDMTTLAAHHFPGACENDAYALAGALLSRGLFSVPQLHTSQTDVRDALSEFRRQVALYIGAVRHGDDATGFGDAVEKYGRTFLGGQLNSQTRRSERREIIMKVLDEVAEAPSQEVFSPITRGLIWARSDKICARCGTVVKYPDYHAGHIKPKASGGRATYDNGQVEHASCNQSAGAAF